MKDRDNADITPRELELFEALADCKRMNEDLTGILEKLREDTEAREGDYLREIKELKARVTALKAQTAELKKQAAKDREHRERYKRVTAGEWLAMSESRMGRLLYKMFVLYSKCAKRLKGKG